MSEDAVVSPEEAKSIARRVLAIERVVLRRAWGWAYAVAAAELFLRLLLPVSAYELGLSGVVSITGSLVFQGVIALAGFAVWIWVFRRVYALRFVRRSILGSFWTLGFWTWGLRPLLALLLFALAYAGLIAALTFFLPNFATILFGLAAASTPVFYYSLKVSFPEGLPREGIATLLAFGGVAIATVFVTISPLAGNFIPYLVLWGFAFLVFLFAFLHTRSVRLPEPPKETT